MATPPDVDTYIAGFPDDVRPVLEGVREAMHRAVPGAEETIRYGMPALMFADRYGIHFAGWKHHVGIYPVPRLDPELEAQVAPLRSAKDSVHLRYADPVPYDLVERMTRAVSAQHRA